MNIENFEKKEWFSSRKWGMFTHYLELAEGRTYREFYRNYKDFNDRVNHFDVENYAKTAHEVNAGYVFFTIMQGTKYMCAPNDTYNQITGFKPGEACSERDLIADLIVALDKYDIPLFLYYTADGPYTDKYAGGKFGYCRTDTELVTHDFVSKWTSVLKEYAVRYGDKVHGWWIDSAYNFSGYTEETLKYYYDAVKAGNPVSLLALNNGVVQPDYENPKYEKFCNGETYPINKIRSIEQYALNGDKEAMEVFKRIPGSGVRYSKYEDYTAGEANVFDEYPTQKYTDGSLWHKLSFLGVPPYHSVCWGDMGWDCPGSAYSADYMYNYVKKCNEVGGVVSVDVCLFDDGHIDWGQYEILKKLGTLR